MHYPENIIWIVHHTTSLTTKEKQNMNTFTLKNYLDITKGDATFQVFYELDPDDLDNDQTWQKHGSMFATFVVTTTVQSTDTMLMPLEHTICIAYNYDVAAGTVELGAGHYYVRQTLVEQMTLSSDLVRHLDSEHRPTIDHVKKEISVFS